MKFYVKIEAQTTLFDIITDNESLDQPCSKEHNHPLKVVAYTDADVVQPGYESSTPLGTRYNRIHVNFALQLSLYGSDLSSGGTA